jgi:hypothetical protein
VAPGKAASALAAAATVSLLSLNAGAFCRTTTCDVGGAAADCTSDANGCATSGKPLFWASECGWYGVQKDGSPKLHITYDMFHSIVVKAFGKWAAADCGSGAHPSFSMTDTDVLYAPAACNKQEFNKDAANASIWMFRDNDWPYQGASSTIALTTLTVNTKTGEILDADVEVNSFRTSISTSNTVVTADLESIVTHESGHFLGLAHSSDPQASMFKSYSPSTISIRTLAPDDVAGICEVYPPGNAPSCPEPSPLTGFSLECGGVNPVTKPVPPTTSSSSKSCSMAPLGSRAPAWPSLVLVAMVAAARVRRRRAP